MEEMTNLTRCIKSKQAYFDISNKKIAKLMGKTEKTIGKYINNPLTMTLGDLRLLIRILHLDEEPIVQGLFK